MLNHLTASNEDIIRYCQASTNRTQIIGGSTYGNNVLKLSDQAVIKFGLGVTSDEAANQEFAYEHLDKGIVSVPRVFRYFQDKSQPGWPIGYLVMEFMRGRNLACLDLQDYPQTIPSITRALNHMGQITRSWPGPVGGGKPQGHLWSEYGARTTFKTVREVENWFNERLAVFETAIDLNSCDLRFSHLDLTRRNIILRPDGSVCFLDWASAGFYPKIFEICCLQLLLSSDPSFFEPLLEELGTLTLEDEVSIDLMHRAYALGQRFTL